MSKGNILFVDNDKPFLDTRSQFLERADFKVFKASSLTDAEKILRDHWIQLIITDVRARDDDDINDRSGIEFAQQPEYESIPKIVMTGMPNTRDMREVMRIPVDTNGNGQQIAIDYLDKGVTGPEMTKVVEEIFQNLIFVNQDLEILWKDIGLVELVGLIDPARTAQEIGERLVEAESLIRSLFNQYQKVTISQIHTRVSRLPRLLAYVEKDANLVDKLYVEIGLIDQVNSCLDGYKRGSSANNISSSPFYTDHILNAQTTRYGAVAWMLRGFGSNQYFVSFDNLVRTRSPESLQQDVEQVLTQTIKNWHGRAFAVEKLPLQNAILRPEQLDNLHNSTFEHVVSDIFEYSTRLGAHLELGLLSGNGLYKTELAEEFTQTITHACKKALSNLDEIILHKGVIHGNLNSDSLFFNGSGIGWVVGFSKVSSDSFLILDYLRFSQNLAAQWSKHISPYDWYRLEQARFTGSHEPVLNQYWEKLSLVLDQIMEAALNRDDISEDIFLEGLLLLNLAKLLEFLDYKTVGCDEIQKLINLLISIKLISEKLEDGLETTIESFTIDHNNRLVQIGSSEIELTVQEYRALSYLESCANKTVSRLEISNAVLDTDYDPESKGDQRTFRAMDYNRVTMMMSRLREKVEISPKQELITTVRSKGYRLNL
ncbi:MAG: DNA-binding response regulator [Chloroflexota bacterium]